MWRLRSFRFRTMLPLAGMAYCEEKYCGKKSDFKEGTIKEVRFKVPMGREPQLVCVANVKNKFYIVGPSCSHYSAPLGEGIIDGRSVVCPWHEASFDLETGQPTKGMGLDAIATFPVIEKGDEIWCDYPGGGLPVEDFVRPPIAKQDPKDERVFAIVGGGAAAAACMEALRSEGYTGKIVLVSKESHGPVDTPIIYCYGRKSITKKTLASRCGSTRRCRKLITRQKRYSQIGTWKAYLMTNASYVLDASRGLYP